MINLGITPFENDDGNGNVAEIQDESGNKDFNDLLEASQNISSDSMCNNHELKHGETDNNSEIDSNTDINNNIDSCSFVVSDNKGNAVCSDVIGFNEVEKIKNEKTSSPITDEDIILPTADFISDDFGLRKIKRNRVINVEHDDETYETLKDKPLENEVEIEKHRMFLRLPDFKKIDDEYRATFKKEKLKFARSFGYKTISGAIYDLYYNRGGSFESVGAMLGYEHFSVGIFIRKMGWPTREAGGLQSSKISKRLVAEIRRDFIVKTQWIKSNFARYYKKKAEQLSVDIETIRRIVYNVTFYDENYEVYAEKIRKIAKEKTSQQLVKQKQAVRYEANRVRFKD